VPAIALPDGRLVHITNHMVDRWIETVCPCAAPLEALLRLDRWLELTAVILDVPPAWAVTDVPPGSPMVGCIVAGDYAIPVLDQGFSLYAPTIIARGGLTTSERQARNRDARVGRALRSRARRRRTAQEARSGDRARRRAALAPAFDDGYGG
jgi:hypothetical protein